jgi:hemerythrin
MDCIVWDDILNTGHARMDAEHKELAQRLNRLRDAVERGEGKLSCARALDDIIQHAQAHFELEQSLMIQHRYPNAEQHAAEHAMLLRQVRDYRESFDLDSSESRSDLMRFPEVWLEFHILFSDKALGAFLLAEPGARGEA